MLKIFNALPIKGGNVWEKKMNCNQNVKTSVTYETICLNNWVVPVQLTVIHRKQLDEKQLWNDVQIKETNNFLQSIAEELASGVKHDIGEIKKLKGKYVKLAFCITKSSNLDRQSYLVPKKGDVYKELKFRRLPECDYCIKASVYSLLNVENEQPKTQERVKMLDNLFASIQAESPLQGPLEEENILHNVIQKLEDKRQAQIIKDKCEGTTNCKSKVSNADTEKIQRLRQLSEMEISSQFEKWERDLINIAKGKVKCQRHIDYNKGGSSKRNLDHQLYFLGFDEMQIEWALNNLKRIYSSSKKSDSAEPKAMDYIFRVLLPEFLTRICMDIEIVSYDEAENKLKNELATL